MHTSPLCDLCGKALPQATMTCATCHSSTVITSADASRTSTSPLPSPPLCLLPPGFLLARRYRIQRQLGQGGFATVYKARDITQHKQAVAIKQIHLEMLSLQELLDASDAFNREVNSLSQLRNRHLPRIFAHFLDEQHWYIVIEYIAGQTLEERLKNARHGFMPVQQVLDIGIDLCDVLHYLHTQRPPLIFRDIKPSNIILTRAGKLFLIDFGTARPYRPGWKDTGPLGTPGYAAPEQYGQRAHTTPQTDIYGLGATLQTLLTGQEPLEILQNGIPPERARRIPQQLQAELTHMQESNATRRPRNTLEVRQTLLEIKAQFLSQKLKTAGAFLREMLRGTSAFAALSLILLGFVDAASFAGLVWPWFWVISLLIIAGFTSLSSIFQIRQASQESLARLLLSERISIIWKQLMLSLSVALLISVLIYYIFYLISLFEASPTENDVGADLITLCIIAGIGLLGGLGWLLKRIGSVRAARKRARQSPQQMLMQQKIHDS